MSLLLRVCAKRVDEQHAAWMFLAVFVNFPNHNNNDLPFVFDTEKRRNFRKTIHAGVTYFSVKLIEFLRNVDRRDARCTCCSRRPSSMAYTK